MRIPPLRDWMPLGRPLGEWGFCALLLLMAWSELTNALDMDPLSVQQQSVLVAQLALGVSAIGIVIAIIAGWRIGIRLVWLFAALASFTAAMATHAFGGAPVIDVIFSGLGGAAIGAFVVWYGRRRLYGSITRREWPALVAEHAAAAEAFVATLQQVPAARWTRRAQAEGWSPAEITDHLARTYSQYAGESRGKNSLRNRLDPARRFVARAVVRPRLLAGAAFPKARAPRELRPAESTATPADGAALFRATGDSCLRDLGILVERRPYRTLVHPFLGAVPLFEMLRFASQHVHHHRQQLVGVLDALAAQEHRHDVAP